MFRKLLVFNMLLCSVSAMMAQEKRQFYLEIKEGYEHGNIEVQSKSDNSLQLSMNNKS